MKKASFFTYSLAALILLCGVANASDDDSASLKSMLSEIRHLSASFAQTVLDGEDTVYEASGKLYLARPGKVRWETEYPDEALMVADGQNIWNVDTFVEQVTVLDQRSAVDNNPIILLTSQDEEVWQQFDIQRIDKVVSLGADKTTHGFLVTSLSQQAQISALTLYFNGPSIIGMSTLDAQGQLSQLVFADVNMQIPVDEALFNVSVPESYTLDDQR